MTKHPETNGNFGLELNSGDLHYRAYVGPPSEYDLIAAISFGLVTTLGLRQHHRLLDIGCGSLRIGRLLISYLNSGNYIGIEPNEWLVREGIEKEIGHDLVRIKSPRFIFAAEPVVLTSEQAFDFVLAQSIFSHCTLELMERWLKAIFPILNQDGALVATFKAGEEDCFHQKGINPEDFKGDGWIYPKCPTYRIQTIEELALKVGYRFQLLDWGHPRQTWALFAGKEFDTSWFARKPLSWTTRLESLKPRAGGADKT